MEGYSEGEGVDATRRGRWRQGPMSANADADSRAFCGAKLGTLAYVSMHHVPPDNTRDLVLRSSPTHGVAFSCFANLPTIAFIRVSTEYKLRVLFRDGSPNTPFPQQAANGYKLPPV